MMQPHRKYRVNNGAGSTPLYDSAELTLKEKMTMPKILGIKPQADTRKLIEKFEDEILIRYDNRQLVGNVYVDIQEDRWSVAFAYNYSHTPGLHGHENPLEVRYLARPQDPGSVRVFRSDADSEKTMDTGTLGDGDAFIRFALTQERTSAGLAS